MTDLTHLGFPHGSEEAGRMLDNVGEVVDVGGQRVRIGDPTILFPVTPAGAPVPVPPPTESRLIVTANDEDNEQLQASPWVDANSFHLRWTPPPDGVGDEANERAIQELLDQVRDFLGRESSKPKIISSDGAGTLWPTVTRRVLEMLPGDGSVTYEHFDQRSSRHLLGGYIERNRPWFDKGEAWDGVIRRMDALAPYASRLEPGGALSIDDGKWRWDGQPVNLVGFSATYGPLGTSRHDLRTLLDFLQARGVNFLRVWCIEQWTSMIRRDVRGLAGHETAIPQWIWSGKYQLHRRNPAWLDRLDTFLRLAADRGIAVQVSIFDWGGLRNLDKHGHWRQSPFNPENCLPRYLNGPVRNREWHQEWTKTEGPFWDEVLVPMIQDVTRIVARHPGAFIEIANEPRPTMPYVPEWHEAVSRVAKETAAEVAKP